MRDAAHRGRGTCSAPLNRSLGVARSKLVLASLAVLLLGACGGDDSSSSRAPATADDAIVDIDGIEPLREQFNRDAGSPRLLLIFSPT